MGSVDGDFEGLQAANRRAEVIEWLNALLPEYRLPWDASDEELRELLGGGTILCHIVNTVIPGVLEESWRGYALSEQRSGNAKKFLSVVADMGLPGFSVKDFEEGSLSSVVDCLLVLRDSVNPGLGDNISGDISRTPSLSSISTPPVLCRSSPAAHLTSVSATGIFRAERHACSSRRPVRASSGHVALPSIGPVSYACAPSVVRSAPRFCCPLSCRLCSRSCSREFIQKKIFL